MYVCICIYIHVRYVSKCWMFVKQLDANGETNVDAVKCFHRMNESLIFIHLAFEFTRYTFVSMMIIYTVNGWLSFDQFVSFATSFYVNYIVFTAFEWYFSTDIIERTSRSQYFVHLLTTLMFGNWERTTSSDLLCARLFDQSLCKCSILIYILSATSCHWDRIWFNCLTQMWHSTATLMFWWHSEEIKLKIVYSVLLPLKLLGSLFSTKNLKMHTFVRLNYGCKWALIPCHGKFCSSKIHNSDFSGEKIKKKMPKKFKIKMMNMWSVQSQRWIL